MNKSLKLGFYLCTLLVLSLFACKSDKGPSYEDTPEGNLRKALVENPSQENARKLMVELTSKLSQNKDENARKSILVEGVELGKKHKLSSQTVSFLMPLIRDYNADPKLPDYIFDLGEIMNSSNQTHASDIILNEFINKYPNHSSNATAKGLLSKEVESTEKYILELGELIFKNPDQYGLNKKAAQNYVDACEAFALLNPENLLSPNYLYKAAEIARSLRTFPKTLSLYDWIIDKYPSFEKTPTTLFLKGFVIENELKDEDAAKNVYHDFLKTYPDHDLADDVKFLLENIGKSNEEILKIIEKNKKT